MADDIFDTEDIFTLTDEEGVEKQFSLLGSCEIDGQEYYALVPLDEGTDEYVILKVGTDDDGEECLVSVDDDDEFEKIAEIFDDMLFDEVDYD